MSPLRVPETETFDLLGTRNPIGSPSPPVLLTGELLAGRFRIVRGLGQGGMGQVYEAFDQRLERAVALKVIRPEMALREAVVERFEAEVRLAHRVTHENVCRIFDLFQHPSAGSAPPLIFLTMELISGPSLAGYLAEKGTLDPDTARSLSMELAEGLDAAHRAGVVHADLKPSNILLAEGAEGLRPVITDLGLAVAYETTAGARQDWGGSPGFGTPAYMAPEQLAGGPPTIASDLYAFGSVVYEMLEGHRPPIPGRPEPGRPEPGRPDPGGPEPGQSDHDWPNIPRNPEQEWPSRLRRSILACLDPDPAGRPKSARTVFEALSGTAPIRALLVFRGPVPSLGSGSDDFRIEIHEQGENGLVVLDHPRRAIELALDMLDDASEQRGFAIHVAKVGIAHIEPGERDRWPVDQDADEILATLSTLAQGRRILLSRDAFDLARQARIDRGGASVAETGLRWLAHGAYRVGEKGSGIEIFAVAAEAQPGVADAAVNGPSADPPVQGPGIRRLIHPDSVLGWRPAVGQPLPSRPHWSIERKLGEGGFGEAWLARHTKTGDRRVFKLCYDHERSSTLQREVTLFRLLRYELGERRDIQRILDWNLDTEPYYIETEYASGGDLASWIAKQGGVAAVPLETRLDLVIATAEALAAAHSIGILHKDIKPSNIFIETHSGRPQVQLGDFGIGHALDRERLEAAGITALGLTAPGTPATGAGSRLYIAPEVSEGRRSTTQADVYALGVLLYQVLVGDLGRALAGGWRRDIDDTLLAEDIALAVDGKEENRPSAAVFAQRLAQLETRRNHLERERRLRERAEENREELARARRRRRRLSSALVILGAIVLALAWFSKRLADESTRARDAARVAIAIDSMARDPTLSALVLREVEKPDRRVRALRRQTLNHPLARLRIEFPEMAGASAWSGDGSRLAVSDISGKIHLWETGLPTGPAREIRTLEGHRKPIDALRFGADGKLLVSSSRDSTIRVWDPDGVLPPRVFRPHRGKVWRLGIDPTRRWVVAPSEDHRAYVLRLDGAEEPVVLEGHDHWVIDGQFDPSSERVVTASRDGTVRLWDRRTGDPIRVFEGHEHWVFHATFSPDGRYVVSASRDGTARIWDSSGIEPPKILEGHRGTVYWAHYRQDGAEILTSGSDGTVRTFEADGSEGWIRERTQSHPKAIYLPGGRQLVFSDGVRTYTLDSHFRPGEATASEAEGFGRDRWDRGPTFSGISRLGRPRISADGQWLLTATDSELRIWAVQSDTWGEVLLETPSRIADLAIPPDGRAIAVSSSDWVVRLLELESGGMRYLEGHRNRVSTVVFSPDGQHIATGSEDDTARLRTLDGSIDLDLGFHNGSVGSLAFHPEGSLLATGAFDGSIRLFRTDSARVDDGSNGNVSLDATVPFSSFGAKHLFFSPDGRFLGALSGYRTFGLFELAHSKEGWRLEQRQRIESFEWSCFRFDRSGSWLSATNTSGAVAIFEVPEPFHWPLEPTRVWQFDDEISSCPEFDAAGEKSAFGYGRSGTVRVLDLHGDRPPIDLLGHGGAVTATDFLPDGRVVSGSEDGTVRLWFVDGGDPEHEIEKRVRICLDPRARQISLFESEDVAKKEYVACTQRLGSRGPATP